MAATGSSRPSTLNIPKADLESFSQHLKKSTRILATCGAGLSQASGLPTFRGQGGLWRTHNAMELATPEAFEQDPGLVWQFYSYRRHMALKARPNKAHFALAELARRKPEFLTLTQNVDGLSVRAQHPPDKIHYLHGSLFDVKCDDFFCNYKAPNFTDPIVPALALPTDESDPTTDAARSARELDIADEKVDLPEVSTRDLPRCPSCGSGLLRPGVVWFGEMLPSDTMEAVEDWMNDEHRIDLMLVIGTSSTVYPAAGFAHKAKMKGARVAVINMERVNVGKEDWMFEGDAAEIMPLILKEVIGELPDDLEEAPIGAS